MSISTKILIVVVAIVTLCIISRLGFKCKSCLFETIVKSIWKKLKTIFWWCRWYLYAILVCVILSLVVVHLFSISNPTYLESYPLKIFTLFPVAIFKILHIDTSSLTETQYSATVSDLILLIGFFAAIIPILTMRFSLRKLRDDFKNEHGMVSSPISEEGKDDIEWMLKQFKGGKHITIFAGGFAWLNTNPEMKAFVQQLAGKKKLDLISHGSKEYVKAAFDADQASDLHSKLEDCFRYDSGLGQTVVCTMIKDSTLQLRFLYKGKPDDGETEFNACVLADVDKNRVLLHILSKLTDAKHWGKQVPVETD